MTLREKAEARAKSRYYDSDNVEADILAMDVKCGTEDYEAGYREALDAVMEKVTAFARSVDEWKFEDRGISPDNLRHIIEEMKK